MTNYQTSKANRVFCPLLNKECIGDPCIFHPGDYNLDQVECECYLAGAAEVITYLDVKIAGYPDSVMNMLLKMLENNTAE